MRNAVFIGILAGLLFGVVLVWEGAGAAGLVLLFTLVGLVVAVVGLVIYRIITGDLDTTDLRSFLSSALSSGEGNGRERSR